MEGMGNSWAFGIALLLVFIIAATVFAASVFGVVVLLRAMVNTIQMGAPQQGQWTSRALRHAPMSPYRNAPLHDVQARGAPLWLRLAAGLGVGTGALTTCIVAPTLLIVAWADPRVSGWNGVLVALVALSGFQAGVASMDAAQRAARGKRVRFAGLICAHHVLSAIVCGAASWHSGWMNGAQLFVGYGALGVLLTLCFAYAHRLPGAPE